MYRLAVSGERQLMRNTLQPTHQGLLPHTRAALRDAGGAAFPQIVYLASSEGSSRGRLAQRAYRSPALHKGHLRPTRWPRDPSSRLHSSQLLPPHPISGLPLPYSSTRLPSEPGRRRSSYVPYLILSLPPSLPPPGQHSPLTQPQCQQWRSNSLPPTGRSGPSHWVSSSTGSLSSPATSRRSPL